MNSNHRIIEEGDLVLLYENHESINPIYIKKGQIYNNRYGHFHHDDMIGKEYGSLIKSRTTEKSRSGWLYMLKPSPELWTMSLPHRTQIIYNIDASYICLELELSQGKTICEAGTGTGSLTTHFADCVGTLGKVYTFEFNEMRANAAKEEFNKNGLSDRIIVQHRDVCNNGFPDALQVDAVFLDLPRPWIAIEHAKKVLKNGGKICTFSPCIEQVQNNVKTINSLGFTLTHTVEVLTKPYKLTAGSLTTTKSLQSSYKSPTEPLIGKNYWKPKTYLCQPEPKIKGHTSYLTFACYYC